MLPQLSESHKKIRRKKLEQIPLEEERRIREGEIARTKWLARREIIFAEKRNTAKQMLNDNISVEKISKYTGLPEDEIEKLNQDA